MRLQLLKRIVKLAAEKGGNLDANSLLQHVQDMENDRLELAESLRRLVGANNCNYSLKAMHHEGLFKQAERLLEQLGLDEAHVPHETVPLQADIVDRLILQFSNEGDEVFDPFAGLGTVPLCAVKLKRRGRGCELNARYWEDSLWYLRQAERELAMPTLFDLDSLAPIEMEAAL